jgi:hypothetical protein
MSATLIFANNIGAIITIEQHKRIFLGVQELVVVCCFEFLIPPTLGGHNFFIYNMFLTIFSASNALKGGVQHLLR